MNRAELDDACPGTLRPHTAQDGDLVRVRLPGGAISGPQLRALAHIATQAGSAALELTSRGAVQIRGITDARGVAAAIARCGLLPSHTHDRVRNITSSPLSGRAGGFTDVRPLAESLDLALRSDPAMQRLPGRFWFGIDDGRGDVAEMRPDVAVIAVDSDTMALLLAGADTGVRLAASDAVPMLITIARRFLQVRGNCWRIAELDYTDALLAGFSRIAGRTPLPEAEPPAVGWVEQADGAITLAACVPLGVLPADAAFALAAIGRPMVVTPWRTVLVTDLDCVAAVQALQTLASIGLVFDPRSPWTRVSACVGSPGCPKSAADVRGDLSAAIFDGLTPGRRQHWVGCPRACGSPPTGQVLLATGSGYRTLRGE